MKPLSETQQEFLLGELKIIDNIARALQRQVGNESTLELCDRMDEIKRKIDLGE